VIVKTLETTPKGETHCSTRTMAKAAGMSHTMVGRIWRTIGLQPGGPPGVPVGRRDGCANTGPQIESVNVDRAAGWGRKRDRETLPVGAQS